MSGWDLALIATVTAMVAVMAVLRTPRRKALVLTFPVPFTIAALALGRPIDVTHVAALPLLLAYTLGVWALHREAGLHLVASIVASATGFVMVASALNRTLPRTDESFWLAVIGTALAAVALLRVLPVKAEPAVRRDLPLAVKLPIVLATVTFLVWIKDLLGGFMTLFPMVGVLASYENRAGLWSNARQIPVVMLTMLPLMVVSRWTETQVGLPASLAIGWFAFSLALAPFLIRGWRASPSHEAAHEEAR